MRMPAVRATALLSAAAIAASAAAATDAKVNRTKKIKCHVVSYIQKLPTASAPGTDFSLVTCSAPFGRGLQYSTFKMMPTTSTTGIAILRFKAFFNIGSVSGVWRATYRFTDAKTGLFKQKVTWTHGTGVFKHVRATGTGTGVLHGSVGKIDQVLTVTGLPGPKEEEGH